MSAVVSDLISAAGTSSNRYPSLDFVSTSSPHDEYELIQRIGSGTYGDVYKVTIRLRDSSTMRFVCLGKTYSNGINACFKSD